MHLGGSEALLFVIWILCVTRGLLYRYTLWFRGGWGNMAFFYSWSEDWEFTRCMRAGLQTTFRIRDGTKLGNTIVLYENLPRNLL
jgi:hypothetical protein